MSAAGRARRIVWIRRGVQAASLLAFFALVLATRGVDGEKPALPLGLYFDIDPLVLVATWLATHTLVSLSLLALVTVLVTILLGRVFCGWICPLGALHNSLSWLKLRAKALRARRDDYSRWQRAKYWLLLALLLMSVFGAHWIGVFDPASLLYRSLATVLLPALHLVVEGTSTAIFVADPSLGGFHLTSLSEPIYEFCRDHLFHGQRHVFGGAWLIFLVFVAALLANLVRPRFWCRYVCPLGAGLGLLAGRTVLRLSATGACGDCRLCVMSCPAAAQPEKPNEWLPRECFGCWNCVASCGNGAIDFKVEAPWRRPTVGRTDLGRRAVLTSLLGGLGGLLLLKAPPLARGRTYSPALIRPPGSLAEPDFLDRCVQCGLCMKVCPTNALHPATAEAGLEGLWSPVLVPRLGWCEYECRLCGEVCPTGAIAELPLADKKQVKMGLAYFDTTRCLPYAYRRECIVCEEHCPVPDKAIYFVETEVTRRDGSTVTLKQPRVDPDRCTGCGICETKCVFRDQAAIRVTSANETRHPGNRPILPGGELVPLGAGESETVWDDPYD